MADFCFQCSVDMWFDPPGDLGNLCAEGEVVNVLCEGCGAGVWVDHEGWCVTDNCAHKHGIPSGLSEVYERAYRQWKARSGPLGWFYRLHDTVLGSPWSPGLIHCDPRWSWWYNLARAVYHGYPLTVYTEGVTVGVFDDTFTPANLEMAFYGTSPKSDAREEPAPAGTRPPEKDH